MEVNGSLEKFLVIHKGHTISIERKESSGLITGRFNIYGPSLAVDKNVIPFNRIGRVLCCGKVLKA